MITAFSPKLSLTLKVLIKAESNKRAFLRPLHSLLQTESPNKFKSNPLLRTRATMMPRAEPPINQTSLITSQLLSNLTIKGKIKCKLTLQLPRSVQRRSKTSALTGTRWKRKTSSWTTNWILMTHLPLFKALTMICHLMKMAVFHSTGLMPMRKITERTYTSLERSISQR